MSWTGNTGLVGELAYKVKALGTITQKVLARASVLIGADIDNEFSGGHDPYGMPWDKLSEATLARGRNNPPLTDSGAMRQSVNVRPEGPSSLLITIAHPALPHQDGWIGPQGSGPPRPLVPPNAGVMPDAWEQSIEAALEELVQS